MNASLDLSNTVQSSPPASELGGLQQLRHQTALWAGVLSLALLSYSAHVLS